MWTASIWSHGQHIALRLNIINGWSHATIGFLRIKMRVCPQFVVPVVWGVTPVWGKGLPRLLSRVGAVD